MNDDQTRFLNSAKGGAHVLADNTLAWDAVPARATKHTDLNNSIASLDLLLADQVTDHTGLADNKKMLKLDAGKKAALVAKPMAVYAKDVNNLTLLGEIDFELSDLIRGKDVDLEAKWLIVFQRATTNALALVSYGVTGLQITDINNARTAFMNASADPQAASAHKQAVTLAITNEFKHLRSIVTDIQDMAKAIPANAALVTALNAALELNPSGVHHVEARIIFKDANTGVLLKHVKFTLSQGGVVILEKHSTPRGLVQLKDVTNGNYTGTSELENYQKDVKINMGIESGKILDVVVLLTVNP